MAIDMQDLYAKSPGAVKTEAPKEATASIANTTAAESKGYTAQTQDMSESQTTSGRMVDITKQDSPLMQRAKQEGLLTAARRGLQNSSIAVGAAQGAMVDRATPLAQQDASLFQNQALANQAAVNRAGEVNTGRETDVNVQNAAAQNQAAMQGAQLQTDVSKYNVAASNDVNLANTQAENAMRTQIVSQNSELNRQFLAGTQAMDLATIQGQYNQLISTNETAARLYDSYFNSIAQSMANNDLPPDRIAQYVNIQQSMLEAGLRMMDQMNALNLDTTLPGAVATGTGNTSTIAPGQAPAPAPAPAPVAAPAPAPTTAPAPTGGFFSGGIGMLAGQQ